VRPSGERTLGATRLEDGRWRFVVWAPFSRVVELALWEGNGGEARTLAMEPVGRGYHTATVDGPSPGARYRFRLEGGRELPDPASMSQPEGVHGPSALVDLSAWEREWGDRGWAGRPLEAFVIYELHVGTFTPEGTFDGMVKYLDDLRDLGVTAIEVMPVAQFPGTRNWGYDGVFPYAVQDSYGGPDGLRRLIEACHALGLAVVLDVVYNHLGPEGNHLGEFGPYFTDRYRAPWGPAINFDGPGSDEVRRYFVENALHWLEDFHIDALRIDAIHGIVDTSARPFLMELAEIVDDRAERLGRHLHLIAESDLGDVRVIRPRQLGGFGLAAQWADDFHHSVHSLLTGERAGYYGDFGSLGHLAQAYTQAFVYTGQHSNYRDRRHGSSTAGIPAKRFVVYGQNHDQVGNRMLGERLSGLVGFEQLKLAAGAVLLSPFVPLLFMGEEHGEEAPFHYFVSHSDPGLAEAVRLGRREEFAAFGWAADPPDPQDEQTFLRSKLRRDLRHQGRHRVLWELYRELLRLRRDRPSLASLSKAEVAAWPDERAGVLLVLRGGDAEEALILFHFGEGAAEVHVPFAGAPWRRVLDSADPRWGGPGSLAPEEVGEDAEGPVTLQPNCFAVYVRSREGAE
jgi:maltooligosyltrehalose trehalohydrolase